MKTNRGFTLIELSVCVSIICVLVGLLLPGLAHVRMEGRKVSCASNLHQLGAALGMYRADNDGYYPIGRDQVWAGGKNFESRLAHYLTSSPNGSKFDPTNPVLAFYDVGGGSDYWFCEQRLRPQMLCPEVLNKWGKQYPYVMGYAYNDTMLRNDGATTALPITEDEESTATRLVANSAGKIAMVCNAQGGIWAYAGQRWSIFNKTGWDQSMFDLPIGDSQHYMLNPPYGIHGGTDNYLFCDGHVESINPTSHAAQNRINRAWFEGLPVDDPYPASGRANPWNDPDYNP